MLMGTTVVDLAGPDKNRECSDRFTTSIFGRVDDHPRLNEHGVTVAKFCSIF